MHVPQEVVQQHGAPAAGKLRVELRDGHSPCPHHRRERRNVRAVGHESPCRRGVACTTSPMPVPIPASTAKRRARQPVQTMCGTRRRCGAIAARCRSSRPRQAHRPRESRTALNARQMPERNSRRRSTRRNPFTQQPHRAGGATHGRMTRRRTSHRHAGVARPVAEALQANRQSRGGAAGSMRHIWLKVPWCSQHRPLRRPPAAAPARRP